MVSIADCDVAAQEPMPWSSGITRDKTWGRDWYKEEGDKLVSYGAIYRK